MSVARKLVLSPCGCVLLEIQLNKQVQRSALPIASSLLITTSTINILDLLMIRRQNLQGFINQPLQSLGGVDISRDTAEKGERIPRYIIFSDMV